VTRSGSFPSLPGSRLLGATIVATSLWAGTAETSSPEDGALPQVEFWSGGEAFRQIWSVYSGGSFAPFGSVREDGFRLRAVAGYSDYGTGAASFADLLAGYHKQLGPVTLKVLAGMTTANHNPDDPLSAPQGTGFGGKGVVEVWWNITDQVWASTDLSWASLHSLYSGRARLGWRLWPELSAGLEGGSAGTPDHDIARIGGFVRYEWASGELSVSGGLLIGGPGSHWEGPAGPFGTVSILTRF
jgi:hypothetical protein